jgi:hypothetical protein
VSKPLATFITINILLFSASNSLTTMARFGCPFHPPQPENIDCMHPAEDVSWGSLVSSFKNADVRNAKSDEQSISRPNDQERWSPLSTVFKHKQGITISKKKHDMK